MPSNKIDPYNSKELFAKWKQKEILNINKKNAAVLREYIADMERGLNVGGTMKGPRSPKKLLSLAYKVAKMIENLEKHFKLKDITKITEQQLHDLFLKMTSGEIPKTNGEPYKDVADYIKRFKSFWHWHMKKSKKAGEIIPEITEDLSATTKYKPPFVYFTKEQLDELVGAADYELKPLLLFLFDSGIRAPTEVANIRVNNFHNDFKQVEIREDISKTFGRKIKLLICPSAVKKYINDNDLTDDDRVFKFSAPVVNRKLRLLGKKILGNKTTLGKEKGNKLSLYDFRHSSACYWLPRYRSRSELLYRFGWTKEKEIIYYTDLLGMKDNITEEDMLLTSDRTELEKKYLELRKDFDKFKKKTIPLINKMLDISIFVDKVKLGKIKLEGK